VSGLFAAAAPEWRAEIGSFDGKEETMTTALPLDTNMLHGISGLSKGTALLQASAFLADVVKPGAAGSHGQLDVPEESDGWARRFYEGWVARLSPEEYSALDEYKREGFRSLNRGLRDHDGDLSMLAAEDRLRAEGLDAALHRAPTLDRPVVVYRGRLPDAVLEAFVEGEEDTLKDQVFGDPAYTSTSLGSTIAREYGGSSRFPDSVGKITLPRGTKAGYVDAVLDKGQGEMLLPREARVRIDKAYRKSGIYWIEGQLVSC
jgi:ADP-ribosyltransferase exoenzyme